MGLNAQIEWLVAEVRKLQKRTTVFAGGVLPQGLDTTDTPQFARLGLGGAADSGAALKVNGQVWIPLVDHGDSGATETINWNDGNEHLVVLTDDCAFTFSNPKDGGRYVLNIDTGAGGFTPTYPATVRFVDDVEPDLSAAGQSWLLTFLYRSGDNLYLASFNGPYDLAS